MRTPVITHFAKNDRALSGRRRIAVLAATTVLAGGIQFLATDSAWACGDERIGGPVSVAPGTATASPDAALVSAPSSVVADGRWNEVTLKVTDRTGVDAHGMEPFLGLYTPGSGSAARVGDVRMQLLDYTGTWKDLTLIQGCYRVVDAASTQRSRLDNGSSATFKFRFSLSPNTPEGVTTVDLLASANSAGATTTGGSDLKPVKVTRTRGAAPAAPTTPAKPTKPAPTKTAKPAPAEPASDRTPAKAAAPAKAPAAPAATPTAAPATTAPAGTPELAQTGSSSANSLLALSSAVLLALGAGVLVAVRRLRPQR
ncbi:LAETG motif-containing sortase-dependent surface protein [Kitasatospora sp. NPDC048545]|uniref:LAETG motif-containing sortase-dependent surface protein n=1 Tax=Kitasatospora sp. NPDC048545 TaxID=3157208 RepID=UPI0033EF8E9F